MLRVVFSKYPVSRPQPRVMVLCGLLATATVYGQEAVMRLAEKEAVRRQQTVISASDELNRAALLLRQGKTQEAVSLYESLYQSLPDAPLTEDLRKAIRDNYVESGLILARQKMAEGRREDSETLISKLLEVSRGDRRVIEARQQFADPDRYPPALSAEHVGRVGEVQRLLVLANSAHEIGDFEKALVTYQEVLRIDPANAAARRGMEQVERQKSRYFGAGYDHQRAKMFGAVDRLWEDPVPATAGDVTAMFGAMTAAQTNTKSGRQAIVDQLRTYMMPKVDFAGATISEVVELLRIRSRDLDPTGKGVDFVVNVPDESANKAISLSLESVPMEEVLRYVTGLAGVAYRIEDYAVQITSVGERNSAIVTRTFRVPPDFIQNSPAAAPPAAGNDPFAAPPAPGGGLTLRRMGAKEFLESRGVPFPDGSSASFNASTSTLVVRNSVANMEMVESLVEMAAKSAPKMARIQVRMIEVNQKNLDEIGFDWLLGGIGLHSNSLFVGGGVAGNGTPHVPANYPFGNAASIPGIVVNGNQVFPAQPVASAVGGPAPLGTLVTAAGGAGGGGPITSGLRSGGFAVGSNALDSLLATGSANAPSTVAPGVLSVAGVYGSEQFQTILRGLSQKKGVNVNSCPSVTTKSGVKATVEITREFIYPTEFDPPQLPQGVGGGGGLFGGGGNLIATPTTPTAFEMKKTGVQIEVEPVIADDAKSVEITIAPEMTDFEGFVNYGSPIFSPSSLSYLPIQITNLLGGITNGYVPLSQPEQLITPNLILQPIFKTQKVSTSVKVWDGQTVVLGGVKRQDITLVNDKVPLLGDLPFVGHLFQSNVKQTETKNIIIFVSVDVIDPSGQKVNAETAAVAR